MGVRKDVLLELVVIVSILISLWGLAFILEDKTMPNTTLDRSTRRILVANHRLAGPDALDISSGLVEGYSVVNKFGRTTNADNNDPTDIWDRANSNDDVAIFTPPTTSRLHDIVSDSINDTDGGTGARTIRIFGLTDWDSDEISEDITLNGTIQVPTANSYVIIHRMRILTAGSGGTNAGNIAATADTDATVSAQINLGQGQTQMAIYGIPSTKTAYMEAYYASLLKAASATTSLVSLLVNPEPDNQLATFLVKHTNGLDTAGTSYMRHVFRPQFKIPGPAIVKLQANANANNSDISGGFDLTLREN